MQCVHAYPISSNAEISNCILRYAICMYFLSGGCESAFALILLTMCSIGLGETPSNHKPSRQDLNCCLMSNLHCLLYARLDLMC